MMLIEKQYIGEFKLPDATISYYFIQKDNLYGVELVEDLNHTLKCTSEFFSEIKELALEFVTKLFNNKVTSTTLSEVLDDYLSL